MSKLAFGTLFLSLCATPALANFTALADVQRGQSVTVQGVVDRFFDTDEIRLRDDTGTVRVDLGAGSVPIQSGERIIIEGIMDDDLFMNELYARQIVRENGDEITVSRDYY